MNIEYDGHSLPLHFAIISNNYQAAELLLQYGANKNLINLFGDSPISIAAGSGFTHMIELLNKY